MCPVVGCQTPDLPPGMWYRRVDDVTMQVGCNSTSQVWQWMCDSSHKWQGHQGLCDMLEASGHGRGQLGNHRHYSCISSCTYNCSQ
jgi:hypothetical protein